MSDTPRFCVLLTVSQSNSESASTFEISRPAAASLARKEGIIDVGRAKFSRYKGARVRPRGEVCKGKQGSLRRDCGRVELMSVIG